MIRVAAPSRLHFGIFRLPTEESGAWSEAGGDFTAPMRHFGGVGLMIDKPGAIVSAARAQEWSAAGPFADRALAYAQSFLRNSPELEQTAFTLEVEVCAPLHMGLGTGTQLGLAVAKALATALGRPDWDAALLAHRIDRGQRSAIGVHGFQHGGLLVDGGKTATTTLAPLIARHDFPTDWAIVLVLPRDCQGVHGQQEREAFAHLAKSGAALQQTDILCRLVLLGILPALVEHDLPAFGEALYEFNHRVGELFKPWQGGIYANPKTADVINFLRKNGVHGVGQSSWGPAVFAIDAEDRGIQLAQLLRQRFAFAQDEVLICRASNQGGHLLE